MFHQESSHSPLAKLFIAILDFKMLALDVKMEAFETLKVAYCLAKQCLSFYFAVGCGGGRRGRNKQAPLTLETEEEVKSQSTFAVH